jgi:hypothetical protein
VQVAALAASGAIGHEKATPWLWLGTVVLAVGLWLYARSKGQSGAFCVAALGSLLGLILVAVLPNRLRAQEPTAGAEAARSTRGAAMGSWVAPLVGLLVCSPLTTVGGESSGAVVGGLVAGIALGGTGIVAAMVALSRMELYGSKGILWPATAGLGLSGLLLVGGPVATVRGRLAERERLKRAGMAAALEHPGWVGQATLRGASIVVCSWDDASEAAEAVRADLSRPASLVTVGVDNSGGALPW